VTRTHSLAEAFSALSGAGVHIRRVDGSLQWSKFSPRLAAAVVAKLRSQLEYCDLAPDEVIAGLQRAQIKAVQGGQVHDLLHALAAEKAEADELWTLDGGGFRGLSSVTLRNPAETPFSEL
jgi:hypothetical protein